METSHTSALSTYEVNTKTGNKQNVTNLHFKVKVFIFSFSQTNIFKSGIKTLAGQNVF